MADERTVVEKESDEIRADMTETRLDLADKMGSLEQGIMNTVQYATSAVTDTVANVQETVAAVRGAFHDSFAAIGHAFDLPAHVRRNPWLLLGGAMLAGFLVGRLLERLQR